VITDILSSHLNHGERSHIIATVTSTHEIEITAKDILNLLANCGSDDMAKLVNELGRLFNKQELDVCYAVVIEKL